MQVCEAEDCLFARTTAEIRACYPNHSFGGTAISAISPNDAASAGVPALHPMLPVTLNSVSGVFVFETSILRQMTLPSGDT